MKFKKGDNVKMRSGKDKGKEGKILTVLPREEKIIVEGLNLVAKHVRARKQGQKGQIIRLPRPIFTGKVQLVCPKCSKVTRLGWRREGGKKERVCKKCERPV